MALWQIAMVLVVVATGQCKTFCGAETSQKQSTAADLVREVYEAEAWIHQVGSCLIRTRTVHSEPANRKSIHRPSAAEFEQLRDPEGWKETSHTKQEVAWDKTRVRGIQDYAESQWMVTAWDGRIMTVHEKVPWRDRENYGIYDNSQKYTLSTRRSNLWVYSGLAASDHGAWWYPGDYEKERHMHFLRPEDFSVVGKSPVDGRECHVVQSRAGGTRLYIDTADHHVRRITGFSIPNDLDKSLNLAAMRKVADVELATPRDWRRWLDTLTPDQRHAASKRLGEERFVHTHVRREIYPTDYVEVVPGGWMPRRYTLISTHPDWDVVKKTGKYTAYKVRRYEVEVTELKINEALSDQSLTIEIPEGGKVYDWRFDPPAEYEFRKDLTEEEIRALAEEARRKRDERLTPYREMVARIEKRVGQKAPALPQATWFNSAPLEVSNLRGKGILLNFWATWCGPCHNDIRTLVSLNKSSTSDPLVIGIHDANADIDVVKNSIAEEGIKYPVSIDVQSDAKEGVSLRSWYRIRGIPYTILIDKNGHVAGHGALDDMLEKATSLE